MHSVRTCKYTEHYGIRPSPFVSSQVAPLFCTSTSPTSFSIWWMVFRFPFCGPLAWGLSVANAFRGLVAFGARDSGPGWGYGDVSPTPFCARATKEKNQASAPAPVQLLLPVLSRGSRAVVLLVCVLVLLALAPQDPAL